jgi:hypothetical protein
MPRLRKRDSHEFIPLTPMVLQILLALADGDKHGFTNVASGGSCAFFPHRFVKSTSASSCACGAESGPTR